jgi:hypothetical protein
MSELTGGAATGGQIGRADAASGGTPDESDLPSLQGLDEAVDDPSDPEAARSGDDAPGEVPFSQLMSSGDSKSASDPMPDMSGTSGS